MKFRGKRTCLIALVPVWGAVVCWGTDVGEGTVMPALTSRWRLVWERRIPIARKEAEPLVVEAGRGRRLWVAAQRAKEVHVYSPQGGFHGRIRVANRGEIVALGFDRSERVMVAQQRREMRLPLGELRIYKATDSNVNTYELLRSRTYPKQWTGRSVLEELDAARERGEYTEVTSPKELVLRGAAIAPAGSVYVIVPILGTIERLSADGMVMTRFLMSEVRPWSPCWIVVTRDRRVVVGDAAQNRIVVLDGAGRRLTSWPMGRVREQVAYARPGDGWVLMDGEEQVMRWYGRDGVYEGAMRLPRVYAAVAMPDERTLWLFDKSAWVWHEYRATE